MIKGSLRETKKRINIDQMNILTGVVLSNGQQNITVRLATGKIKRVSNPSGITYFQGDILEIKTDGTYYQVSGKSSLNNLAAEASFSV